MDQQSGAGSARRGRGERRVPRGFKCFTGVKTMKLRPEVQEFAEQMERILRLHYKRGGWDDMDRREFMYIFKKEVDEVFAAKSVADLRHKVIETACICSMIWLNSQRDFWWKTGLDPIRQLLRMER
jgi:hypothetical protein